MSLFNSAELAAYLQVSSVSDATFSLLRKLVTGEVESETGDVDLLTDAEKLTAKTVALEAAARAYRNPQGFTSWAIDDARFQRGAEAVGVYLTAAERSRLRRLVATTDSTTTGSVALRPTWRSW